MKEENQGVFPLKLETDCNIFKVNKSNYSHVLEDQDEKSNTTRQYMYIYMALFTVLKNHKFSQIHGAGRNNTRSFAILGTFVGGWRTLTMMNIRNIPYVIEAIGLFMP